MRNLQKPLGVLLVVALAILPLTSVRVEASEPNMVITDVDVELYPERIVISFSEPTDKAWAEKLANFHLESIGRPYHAALAEDKKSVTLRFSGELPVGKNLSFVVKNMDGAEQEYDLLIAESIRVGSLQEKITARNRTVKTNDLTLDMLSVAGEGLETLRDALYSNYIALDQTLRNYPPVVLPYNPATNAFETLVNNLTVDAYDQQLSALQATRKGLMDQMTGAQNQATDAQHSKAKLELQRGMIIGQLTWAAENLVFAYQALNSQLEALTANKEMLELQLVITRLQHSFGMAKALDVHVVEQSLGDLANAEKTLRTQMDNMKREINLLLGQPYNTPLQVKNSWLSEGEETIEWDKDLKAVLDSNYSLRVTQYDSKVKRENLARNNTAAAQRDLDATSLKYRDDKAKLELAFFKAHQDLETAARNLEAEKAKFALEEEKYAHAVLRHNLGLTSRVQYMTDTNAYSTQERRLRDLELDYFKAMRKYHWFINGLTL